MDTERNEFPDSCRSWIVAAVGTIGMMFTFGTPFSYGVFQQPFSVAFNISPVALSIIFSLMLFTFFIGSGAVGVFATRLPARVVLLGCAGITGMLTPLLYVTTSYLGLALIFAVLGLALGTVFVLLASIVPRWFEAYRGVATGLIFMGNGMGLFVFPPLWQIILTRFGVQRGFLLVMSVTTIVFSLVAVTCRRPRWVDQSTESTVELFEWVSCLAQTRTFQLLFLGIGLAFAWYQLLAAYAIDLFAYRGLTDRGASTAFGLIGGVSIISRIGGGYITDRVGSRQAFLVSLGCSAVGVGLFFAPQIYVLALGVFLAGLGFGGCATLYIPLLMEIYTPEKDTAIVGVFNIALGICALIMPLLGTVSVTYANGYTITILFTLVIILTSFGLTFVATDTRMTLIDSSENDR